MIANFQGLLLWQIIELSDKIGIASASCDARGIQMRIREELRPEGEQKQDLVDSLVKEFEAAGVGSCCAGFVWVCCSMLQQFGAAAR